MMHHCGDTKGVAPAVVPAIRDRRIRKIAARIVAAPHTKMELLAREANLSVSWMQQLFKKHTGECITNFIIRRRILRAAHLLRTTELRIKEIAAHVGYSKTPTFDRIFARITGQNPGDYRNASESQPPLSCHSFLDFVPPTALLCPVCAQCEEPPPPVQ